VKHLIWAVVIASFWTVLLQPAFSCTTPLAGTEHARKKALELEKFERRQSRKKKIADTVVIGVLEIDQTQQPVENEYGLEIEKGTIFVERVLRGVEQDKVEVEFYAYDLRGYCSPQFVPHEGERAIYYLMGDHLSASDDADPKIVQKLARSSAKRK
jgi:hypothetical protein